MEEEDARNSRAEEYDCWGVIFTLFLFVNKIHLTNLSLSFQCRGGGDEDRREDGHGDKDSKEHNDEEDHR